MVSKNTKSSDKQNVELFKFFEKTRQRKTSKTSPKSKQDPKLMAFKLPERRATRLKSDIFLENYPEFLPDGEFDISKEDVDNSGFTIEPMKKKPKLSEDNDNSNTQMLNGNKYDALNATLDKTESRSEIIIEHCDLEKSEKRKQIINTKTSDIQKIADNLLETIDTNAIAEMLKDTSLDDCEEEVFKKTKVTKRKEKGTQSENSEQLIEPTQSDSGLQLNNNVTKSSKINDQSKQRRENFDLEDNEKYPEVSKKSKSKKKKRKSIQTNTDLENDLYDNNPQLSLTISDYDGDLEKFSKNDEPKNINMENKKSTHESKKSISKKRKRKLNLENRDNILEISLIVSDDDADLEMSPNIYELSNKSDTNPNDEELKDSIVEIEQSDVETNNSKSILTNNTDLENDNLEKSANSVQPKKRGRKPKTLNNSLTDKNTSPNTNGILKYFSVKDKNLDENVQSKNLFNENSEPPINNTLNYDNTQISPTENSATISEQKTTRSRRSNNLNTTDTSLVKTKLNKTGNSEKGPRQKGRPRVIKVNVAKEFNKKTIFKISKLTKDQIKKCTSRKIPKNRLDEVLEMIDHEDHPMWEDRNISCNPCIHAYWESRHIKPSDQNMKLKYARQFLLRRDWTNLSKILCLYNSDAKMYYPLLSKYAALLLAHTDSGQFDKFIQFLTSMTDSSAVIKKCTKISKDNEE